MLKERIYNYFDRNPELKVLFIFDRMGSYENDLLDTSWPEDYVYKVYDGKWFNLKVDINRSWKDKRVVLLFPLELRPDTEEKRLKFPLLDVYAANMEFKDERYDEFIQQYGLPSTLTSFVKTNYAELTSNKISQMLSGYLDANNFSIDLACRAFISSYLGDKKLLDWETIIIKMVILSSPNEEKKNDEFYLKLYKNKDAKKVLEDKLKYIFGVSFNENVNDKMRRIAEILKYNAITQSLTVAPEDDYKALKINSRILLDQINRIYEKGLTDPQLSSKFISAMQELGAGIRENELIKVYGADAPYYYMTEEIGIPIIKTTITESLISDPEAAMDKMRSLSLRVGPDSGLMPLIRYVETAASFYDEISKITSLRLDTPADYISLYVETFYRIDKAYRLSIEQYYNLPDLSNALSEEVKSCKKHIDRKYAQITNDLNNEWLDCVIDTDSNFKKTNILRQNDFYSTYQDPKKLVVIISDGLRYEVAVELYEELAKLKHIAKLSPMLSLLPSETKYCKPALFPHQELKLVGDKMEVDGKVLSDIKKRTEQLCRYKPESVCVNFDDVATQVSSHRELFKHPLVYVLHDRIDNTGHDQSPKEITDSCRKTIDELVKFIHSLHMTLNCRNVIVTSDHGFLFNDIKFEDKDKISIKEENIESTTRYYLTHNEDNVDEVVKFDIIRASSIESDKKTFVATPKGTNRFAASGGYKYTHGGASLQEMIIPIIHSNRRDEQSKKVVDVVLKTNNLNMVSSRLRFQLVQKEAVSMDVISREVVCRVYDGDRIVSDEVKINLNSTDALNVNNRTFDVTLKLKEAGAGSLLQLRVYDADPQKQLNPLIKETVKNNTIIEQDF